MSPFYAGQDLMVSSCRHLNGMLQFDAQPVKLFNFELEHASTSGCAFSTLLRYMLPLELPLAQHVLDFNANERRNGFRTCKRPGHCQGHMGWKSDLPAVFVEFC